MLGNSPRPEKGTSSKAESRITTHDNGDIVGLVLRRLFLCPQKNSVFLLFVMMSTSMDCPITFMLFIRSVDIGHTIILS